MTRTERPRSTTARRAAVATAALLGVVGITAPPAGAARAEVPQPSTAGLRLPAAARAVTATHDPATVLEPLGLGVWSGVATGRATPRGAGVPAGPQVDVEDAERLETFLGAVATRRREALRTVFFAAAERKAAQERAAAERAAAERAAATSARRASSGGGGASDLAGLRNCESGGNYGAVSSSGTYRGAYQFSRSTWNSVAAGSHPHLVGVDPASASPADQDAMARTLHASSGSSPWPVCGRHL